MQEKPQTLRSKLGDEIIEQGPYSAGDPNPLFLQPLTATELNELRDELMRLRAVPQ